MLLRAELLQPGDVFLIRSKGAPSALISALSDGPYSHAAVYAGHLALFEADTDGIGYRPLTLVKVEITRGPRWLCDVSQYQICHVFRHRSLSALHTLKQQTLLHERISTVFASLNGLQYSKLGRLASASTAFSAVPGLRKAVMSGLGALTGDLKKEVAAMFCSELVAHVFNEIRFPALKQQRLPAFVSPNFLADPHESELVQLDGLFVDADPRLKNDEEQLGYLSSLQTAGASTQTMMVVQKAMRRLEDFMMRQNNNKADPDDKN